MEKKKHIVLKREGGETNVHNRLKTKLGTNHFVELLRIILVLSEGLYIILCRTYQANNH